jgi:hypothetical protein
MIQVAWRKNGLHCNYIIEGDREEELIINAGIMHGYITP